MPSIKRAVLLAAGRGQRLAPHTDHTPKPLMPLAGHPLVEYALCHLREAGIREVLLVVGYRGAQIRDYFADGHALGLKLHYIDQHQARGTGAAALLAEEFSKTEPFFLGWGDIIAARDEYRRLVLEFVEKRPDALMLLERVKGPHRGAAIEIQDGYVTSLIEKPAQSTAIWNQAGLAIYTEAIFPCLHQLQPSERGELEFTAAVQMLVEQGFGVRGMPMQAERLHLTSPEDIPRVEKALRNDARYGLSIAESRRDD